ncbi:SDR family NAD(P)-dependent oxidoreductase [Roseivirga sp. E12]|uniref:SDR family NAD(P)-dependent oxidoreductase n=1 Tax=Roseivirga sp. E12 TaxID=2819237 RepID=UPI001ABC31E0|nr:SDR family NAD(P)-dependent oxidoreductase [Roseivirga sp. E12]
MKKAIVIGASSGIGRALAIQLAKADYCVGITGRRSAELQAIKAQQPDAFVVSAFDNTLPGLVENLNSLVTTLGGLDLLIISSGTGELNPDLDYGLEKPTIDLNVDAFTEIANWGYAYFKQQQSGHMVGITSLAGLRGGRLAPAYNASKAYQINYLEGLRQKATSEKLNLVITDIRPGFVDTAMAKGEGIFWLAHPEKAAKQIYGLIRRKRSKGYVTKRWRLFAGLVKLMPGGLYKRF